MNAPGETDLLAASRAALLDALEALAPHLDAVVVIGAQAVYMHTEAATLALAETTRDSDLAIDSRALGDDPLLDDVMTAAGFRRDLESPQPGSWLSPRDIPVDLMVPEALAGARGRRGARIPPHSRPRRGALPASRPRSSITRPSLCVHSNPTTTARSR